MDERYTNSIIDSTLDYLDRLQYLAKTNPQDVKDIMLLDIIHNIYSWADWYEVSEDDKIDLQKVMETIIFNNPNLTLPTVDTNTYYFNVNIPQTMWTWQRIYDNLELNQEDVTTPFILDESENYLIDESGAFLHFENYL